MYYKARIFIFIIFLLSIANNSGHIQTIMYIPFDNRPVSRDYVIDTVQKGGFKILVPPEEYLGNRTKNTNPDLLWEWVFTHAREVDSIVVSADTLIYGGLVASRTHYISKDVLLERTNNLKTLKDINPTAPIYVFSTIMRSPHASSGGVEPPYYEKYGPTIFQFNALQDKRELLGLTKGEEKELKKLASTVPNDVIIDWLERRKKNFKVNLELLNIAKQDTLAYLLIGRDDCSPYSRSHQEYRWLARDAVDLPANKYISFPGADQLGMVLLARAANDLMCKTPSVAVKYSQGVGEKTIPSYEDAPVGETISKHLVAAGCIPLVSEGASEMILAVHTPVDGWTREAGTESNQKTANAETIAFVKQVQSDLRTNKKVAVADIAFANGSDNALMYEMSQNRILSKLESYSGWNTASNTIGYTIGQAVFAQNMTDKNKQSLIAIRLLDDWAYQANIRRDLLKNVLVPQGYSDVELNHLTPQLITETKKQMNIFMQQNLYWFPLRKIEISFPWNRMFEVEINAQL